MFWQWKIRVALLVRGFGAIWFRLSMYEYAQAPLVETSKSSKCLYRDGRPWQGSVSQGSADPRKSLGSRRKLHLHLALRLLTGKVSVHRVPRFPYR